MNRNISAVVLIVAAVAVFVLAQRPAKLIGMQSLVEPTPTVEVESTSTPTPSPRATCPDGSAMTVTSSDEHGIHYICESGTEGVYLKW